MRSIQPLATKVAATEGLKGADGRKEARFEAPGRRVERLFFLFRFARWLHYFLTFSVAGRQTIRKLLSFSSVWIKHPSPREDPETCR